MLFRSMLAGSFLGKKQGFISNLFFVALVLLGAPILSGGRGGLAILTGPTGGYFIIWPVSGFVIGAMVEKLWDRINILTYIIVNFIGGILLIDLSGAIYLSCLTGIKLGGAILSSAAFIPGDLVKAAIVSLLCMKLKFMSPINETVHKAGNSEEEKR